MLPFGKVCSFSERFAEITDRQ